MVGKSVCVNAYHLEFSKVVMISKCLRVSGVSNLELSKRFIVSKGLRVKVLP